MQHIDNHSTYKKFGDFWRSQIGNPTVLADVKIAAFLMQHWFVSEPICCASIGSPRSSEYLALNSLVESPASMVVLVDPFIPNSRAEVKGLLDAARDHQFDSRPVVADLTIPERWPQILAANAVAPVRLLGVSASWACTEPGFWTSVINFAKSMGSIFYVRGLLDYRQPQMLSTLLGNVPQGGDVEILATTPSSVWWAPSDAIDQLHKMLSSSHLFPNQAVALSKTAPFIVENGWEPYWNDADGRIARAVFGAGTSSADGLNFINGWASPEPDGRWSQGHEATMVIPLPSDIAPPKHIRVTGNGWVPPTDSAVQRVEIGVGSAPTRWMEVSFTDGIQIKDVILPIRTQDIVHKEVTLRTRIGNPGRPSDYGEPDDRLLGFKFRALSLFT